MRVPIPPPALLARCSRYEAAHTAAWSGPIGAGPEADACLIVCGNGGRGLVIYCVIGACWTLWLWSTWVHAGCVTRCVFVQSEWDLRCVLTGSFGM